MKLNEVLHYEIADTLPLLHSVWRWWLDEIVHLLPERMRQSLLTRQKHLFVDFEDGGVRLIAANDRNTDLIATISQRPKTIPALAPELDESVRRWRHKATDTVLRFKSETISRSTIKLPRASDRNIEKMIALELPNLSPIPVSEIYWGYHALASTPDEDNHALLRPYEIWICRKSVLDGAINFAQTLYLTPTAIAAIDAWPGTMIRNLLPKAHFGWRRFLRNALLPTIGATAIALVVAILLTIDARRDAFAERIDAELARKRAQVQHIAAARKQIELLERRQGFLSAQRRYPSVSETLLELTNTIKDSAWVYQLDLSETELRIHGFAPQSNELISALDQSDMFVDVKFRAPIIQSGGGSKERFDISMTVGAQKP